ncbi:MAG TPA: LysM peptidoglycan-binding domain-containing protein [Candidatus Acidoferrales bacterium]|nr:LysM peptidoglycan-binding domain-containing protein [Candidatus Acidoferrales bacterium]
MVNPGDAGEPPETAAPEGTPSAPALGALGDTTSEEEAPAGTERADLPAEGPVPGPAEGREPEPAAGAEGAAANRPELQPAESSETASAEGPVPASDGGLESTPAPKPASEPAVPRPMAAPFPVAGVRSPESSPETVTPARLGNSSILRRIAAVLAMIVLAGVVGYALAFVSAQMVDQSGSALPAVAGSVTASVAPSAVAPASGAPASAVAPSTTPHATAAASAAPASTAASSASPFATAATSSVGASPQYHVVARGETLTSIAEQYGVTVQALAAANGISNPNAIYAGQRLVIPVH